MGFQVGQHLDADLAIDRRQRRVVEFRALDVVGDRPARQFQHDPLGVAHLDVQPHVEQIGVDGQDLRLAVGQFLGLGTAAPDAQVFDLANRLGEQPDAVVRLSGARPHGDHRRRRG